MVCELATAKFSEAALRLGFLSVTKTQLEELGGDDAEVVDGVATGALETDCLLIMPSKAFFIIVLATDFLKLVGDFNVINVIKCMS